MSERMTAALRCVRDDLVGLLEAASLRQLCVDAGLRWRERLVDHTAVFSPGENAITKEPGSSYLERWRCVS